MTLAEAIVLTATVLRWEEAIHDVAAWAAATGECREGYGTTRAVVRVLGMAAQIAALNDLKR